MLHNEIKHHEDNQAAILMINSSWPIAFPCHIDIQHLAIQEWKANVKYHPLSYLASSSKLMPFQRLSALHSTIDVLAFSRDIMELLWYQWI
jgi:hypothetical protein